MGRRIVLFTFLLAALAVGPPVFADDGGGVGDGKDDDVHHANTPEPGTLLLIGTGIAGLGVATWRRLRK